MRDNGLDKAADDDGPVSHGELELSSRIDLAELHRAFYYSSKHIAATDIKTHLSNIQTYCLWKLCGVYITFLCELDVCFTTEQKSWPWTDILRREFFLFCNRKVIFF